MSIVKKLILMCAILVPGYTGSAQSSDKEIPLFIPVNRTVLVVGRILSAKAHTTILAMDKLAEKSLTPIYLIIESTGGTDAGLLVINKIKELQNKGVKSVCVVGKGAYGMAFFILNACSERWIQQGSVFMWVSAKPIPSGPNRKVYPENQKFVDNLNKELKDSVVQNMKISGKTYDETERTQTPINGITLKKLAPDYVNLFTSFKLGSIKEM